jgi:hypothetical protein
VGGKVKKVKKVKKVNTNETRRRTRGEGARARAGGVEERGAKEEREVEMVMIRGLAISCRVSMRGRYND